MKSTDPELELLLQGRCTDHIWTMLDGDEKSPIGVRLDSGDSGVIYFSAAQVQELAKQLVEILAALPLPPAEEGKS